MNDAWNIGWWSGKERSVFTRDVDSFSRVTSVFSVVHRAAVTGVATIRPCDAYLVSSGRFRCLFEGVADGHQSQGAQTDLNTNQLARKKTLQTSKYTP